MPEADEAHSHVALHNSKTESDGDADVAARLEVPSFCHRNTNMRLTTVYTSTEACHTQSDSHAIDSVLTVSHTQDRAACTVTWQPLIARCGSCRRGSNGCEPADGTCLETDITGTSTPIHHWELSRDGIPVRRRLPCV